MKLIDHLKFYLPEVSRVNGDYTLDFKVKLAELCKYMDLEPKELKALESALIGSYVTFIKDSITILGASESRVIENLEYIKQFFVQLDHMFQFEYLLVANLAESGLDPNMEISPPVCTTPLIGSVWQHLNGNRYEVTGFSNLYSTKLNYLPTVHYRNVRNGMTYSKSLNAFEKKMEKYNG